MDVSLFQVYLQSRKNHKEPAAFRFAMKAACMDSHREQRTTYHDKSCIVNQNSIFLHSLVSINLEMRYNKKRNSVRNHELQRIERKKLLCS